MFRRYSLFDSTPPRLSVVPNNTQQQRKTSLGQVPEIRINHVGPPTSKQITALQQRKTRSLSNSPVYRKKKYDNLPTLIDHYYEYTDEDLNNLQQIDQQKQNLQRNSTNKIIIENVESNDFEDHDDSKNDSTDGKGHSKHISRSRDSNAARRNLNKFGNSIGLTRHKRLQFNEDEKLSTSTSSTALSSGGHSQDHYTATEKPLQPLVFNTHTPRRSLSPVHSCLLVRRRSDFSDPSFAQLPPLENSLKVSFFRSQC